MDKPPEVNTYAGFWIRGAAYIIDSLIWVIPSIAIFFFSIFVMVYSLTLLDSETLWTVLGISSERTESETVTSIKTRVEPDALLLTWGISLHLLMIVIWWVYSAAMESSSKQATLGKMAAGLKVTDENGNRISFARATGRFFGKFLFGYTLIVGFLMVAFTKKKQGLHDIIAKTFVIRIKR